MDCLEGIMYGGDFVQGGFVWKWLMSRGSYVWRGFCPRGFCPRTKTKYMMNSINITKINHKVIRLICIQGVIQRAMY